ncbi:MFS transporter [Streptomyces sp. NRRL F-5053]|uniref:MFS transporter n=1 Tax=Streptomyces sp. NRRL F-5053 TaxID=1463854 RepID=UPI000AB85A76|nr:MFS transporter [Streptomyces sp. NRRL F-5053]
MPGSVRADGRRPRGSLRRGGAPWRVLALACSAQFLVVLDVSVVNVALPAVRDSLGFRSGGLAWVANSYALAFAGCLLLGGRLADLYGHRRVFARGLALFTGASLAGGLATTPAALLAARTGQGLGAAVLAPATLTLVTAAFPEGVRRARALAVWTAVSSAGGAAGNVLGGLLTETLGWRSVLLVNVPAGLALLVAARTGRTPRAPRSPRTAPAPEAPAPGPGRPARLDVPGAVTATAGAAALTYGLSSAQESGWGAPGTLCALLGGAVALAVFALVEIRYAARPLLPPRLLRLRAVAVGNALMLLAGACLQTPVWYFLTFYMQDVLGYSALRTGLGFLPHTLVAVVVGVRVTPYLMRRLPHRTLIVTGALVCAAGFLWQSRAGAGDGYPGGVLGPAVVFSLGGALFSTPATAQVTSGVPAADAGAAAGLMNTAKQFGGALGLAALLSLSGDAARPDDHTAVFLAMAALLLATAALALLLPRTRTPD